MKSASLGELRTFFHREICKKLLVVSEADGIASNADKDQRTSVEIARSIAAALGASTGSKLAAQTAGAEFERIVSDFIATVLGKLSHLRPGSWRVECVNSRSDLVIARYEQYAHLREVKRVADTNPELAVVIGRDYSVASDIVVSRTPWSDDHLSQGGLALEEDVARRTPVRSLNNALPLMHASVSCKWTMRSDRAQNSRFEALNLIRTRKGRVPHIAVVTAEPSPSRLASLALGTGDIDCVYHFALPELVQAVASVDNDELSNLLNIMIRGNRLRDIADLPLDLIA